jgi:hypothetical protein
LSTYLVMHVVTQGVLPIRQFKDRPKYCVTV